MNVSAIGQWVLGSGALIAGLIAIYMARANKKKTQADTGKTNAEEKEIEEKAIALSEATYQSRERFWQGQIEDVKNEMQKDIDALREEVAWLKILIEQHVPWDWAQQRKLTLAGIEHEAPPTLNYIRGYPPKEDSK